MQFKAISLLIAAGIAFAQNQISVNTPTGSIIQCVPVQLTWSGGVAPYTIVVNSYTGPGQTSLITSIGNVGNSPYTFTPSQAVGTRLQFDIRDSTGALGQSGGTPAIAAGSSSSCVSGGSSGSTGSSTSAAAGGSTSAAGSSTSAAAGGSTSRASSTTSASSSATTSARPNSAGSVRAAAGAIAGAVGLAAAALL